MKRNILVVTALLLASTFYAQAQEGAFTLSSPDLTEGMPLAERHVFNGFGCEGGNTSPALSWENAPEGTQSYAVTVYDPDAPTGSGWWHWLVFDLPADIMSLPAGAGSDAALLPADSIQSRNDYGGTDYGGACPPEGNAPHNYIFTVFALGTDSLGLDADASGAMVGFFLGANELARASITVPYGR